MAKIGYARVSTMDQHPEVQTQRLEAVGCERIFIDKGASGAKASRPEWDKCLADLRPGDALVCIHLDRIGRSVRNLVDIAAGLEQRKVDLVVLDQAIDTTTPSGKLLFHIMAAVAEFERSLIVERTKNGLKASKKRGRRGGRQKLLGPAQVALIRHWRTQGWTVDRIREELGKILGKVPGRITVFRALALDDEEIGATVDAETLPGVGGRRRGAGGRPALTPQQVAAVKLWRTEGYSINAIRDELASSGTKVSPQTIYRALGKTTAETPAYALTSEQAMIAWDLHAAGYSVEYIQKALTVSGEAPPERAIQSILPKIDKSAVVNPANSRRLWTDKERVIVMRPDLNMEEMARLTGRSVEAVRDMRAKLGFKEAQAQ